MALKKAENKRTRVAAGKDRETAVQVKVSSETLNILVRLTLKTHINKQIIKEISVCYVEKKYLNTLD